MNCFKAAVFDLDDTLLHDDLSLSDYTIKIFHRLTDSGFHLIPASGRSQMSMKPFLSKFHHISIYISCNGAEIWDGTTDLLLHQETFSKEIGKEIAEFGKEHHVYAQTYHGDKFYFNEHSVYAEQYSSASMLTGEYVGDLSEFINEPRSKILMMADEKKIALMLNEAQERFKNRVSVTSSKPHFLEFNPLNATKGIALSIAARRLDISPNEMIAFGDSLNDMSMLKKAGRSVAVSNARAIVKESCDEVCGSNELDGVAHYLEDRILNKGGIF